MNIKDTQKIASLSNLNLSQEELEKYSKVFSETLSYVENLNELDTSTASSVSSPTGTKDHYFDDGLANSRSIPAGKYVVKRILS